MSVANCVLVQRELEISGRKIILLRYPGRLPWAIYKTIVPFQG